MNKYMWLLGMGLQKALAYRVNYSVAILAAVFPIILQWVLWQSIYQYTKADTLYGMSYSDMLSYVVLAALMAQALRTGFEYDMAEDIKSGGLNRFIVQPLSYFGYRLSVFVGTNLGYFVATLMVMALVLWVAIQYWVLPTQIIHIALFVVSAAGAFLLQFMLFYLLSLTAFWLHEVWALFESVRVISLVLSGGVVPLSVFGESLQYGFSLLPFQYLIYFPLQTLTGAISLEQIFSGLLVQWGWIAAMMLLITVIWRRGSRSYLALGG
ncbi:ABC-2 family transporter protein [Pseudoalteromonas sp. SMS1]|uniref:ABC transporter permease n=1 Tax=Pseudoalteromonas sp. SMS1 TaxID=2908894 RepID=UPI001F15A10F|nr:ABC-2 family transporter protein [Pseudoalteromonas sp. SMS1]MCF2859909.1 ABC-2 family transporter protein [Pseudoalteromonas sp. SMS1]